MDSVLVIDPSLVTGAVQTLAMNTLNAYQNGAAVKWKDAELAVYLVYIFGEINKCEPTPTCMESLLIVSRQLVAVRGGQRSARHQR
jgi:hypothetical protein